MYEMKPPQPMVGVIRFFVRHPNAANLLMALVVIGGIYGLSEMNRQGFPSVETPNVNITVVWPGTSASDVEANILEAIEPEIRFLDGVKNVLSSAREGVASITMEFYEDTDMQKAISDVEAAVNAIRTLPKESERPVITRVSFYENVASILVSGPFSEQVVKNIAKKIRDGLLEAGIERVVFQGVREEEIHIEVSPDNLRRYGLTLAEIAARVGAISQDIPSGTLSGLVEQQIRSLGLATTSQSIGRIEVRAFESGERLLVRDVALVREGFDDTSPVILSDEGAAVRINVLRSLSADSIQVYEKVKEHLQKVEQQFPNNLKVQTFNVFTKYLSERIWLLVKNGLGGFFLVVVTLFIFLNTRTAFWVALGIPISAMATFMIMYFSGQSINLISLFALIMTIGIVVDDAIVVGEHAATRHELGDNPTAAAEQGALRMFAPVLAAVLTTMAAFIPLLILGGVFGAIMGAIPLVVVAVLTASILECFLILPGHMRTALSRESKKLPSWRIKFNKKFTGFRDGTFRRFVERAYDQRYMTVALTFGFLIISIGLLASGRLGFQFFPTPEGDTLTANIVQTAGTPREETMKTMAKVKAALYAAEKKLLAKNGDQDPGDQARGEGEKGKIINLVVGVLGGGTGQGNSGRTVGDNVASLWVETTPPETRDTIRLADIVRAWEEEIPDIPGLENITIEEQQGGPSGKDIDILLQGGSPGVLKKASQEVRQILKTFVGVSGIDDDFPYGKQEIILKLSPRGAAMGFTTSNIGQQIRNAFEGNIAKRFARGDEEVTVRVRLPRSLADIGVLDSLYLQSPTGNDVALSEIVTTVNYQGFARIGHDDGQRAINITANVDPRLNSSNEIMAALQRGSLQEIAERYNLTFKVGRSLKEQAEVFSGMRTGVLIAIVLMYVILAWVFGNYGRPAIILLTIPFGLVGAVFGHLIMGYKLTVLSLVGLFGLAGVLVNGSIILMSQIDIRLREMGTVRAAVIQGITDRLRAVLLTSLTTILGLVPLLFETSRQAQFLMPMSITLVWGLLSATMLILIVVPAALGIQNDFHEAKKRRLARRKVAQRKKKKT